MTERSPARPGPLPAPAVSATEIETLAVHFIEVIDALVDIVKQESELVRAGRLGQATQLATSKAELSRLYLAGSVFVSRCEWPGDRHPTPVSLDPTHHKSQ